jgi:hypothetical protein
MRPAAIPASPPCASPPPGLRRLLEALLAEATGGREDRGMVPSVSPDRGDLKAGPAHLNRRPSGAFKGPGAGAGGVRR